MNRNEELVTLSNLAGAKVAREDYKKIGHYMNTPMGRLKLGETAIPYLQMKQKQNAIGRLLFKVNYLGAAGANQLTVEPTLRAALVSDEGNLVETRIKVRKVPINYYTITSLVELSTTDAATAAFSIFDMINAAAEKDIIAKEDKIILEAVTKVAENNPENPMIYEKESGLNVDLIAHAMSRIERHDFTVNSIIVHPKINRYIRTLPREVLSEAFLDAVVRTGHIGKLYNANLYVSSQVPEDTMLFTAKPEYFGVFSIAQDLTVSPADDVRKQVFGWLYSETVGQVIYNTKTCQGIRFLPNN